MLESFLKSFKRNTTKSRHQLSRLQFYHTNSSLWFGEPFSSISFFAILPHSSNFCPIHLWKIYHSKVIVSSLFSVFKSCCCKTALISECFEFIYVFSRHVVFYDCKLKHFGFVKKPFLSQTRLLIPIAQAWASHA